MQEVGSAASSDCQHLPITGRIPLNLTSTKPELALRRGDSVVEAEHHTRKIRPLPWVDAVHR
jgi:hypothetical protein